MIEPVTNQPALIDQVHDRLVAAIADGTLEPGHKLTQEDIADQLGVSRQPVSHALQLLRRRGLAVEQGKRGLVVAPLDADRLRGLYQVRAVLEGLAAQLAASRVRNGQVPAAQREAVQDALQRGLDMPRDAGVRARIDTDVAFHASLHSMSGNIAIIETVTAEWPHFMRAMGADLSDENRWDAVWSDHAAILAHILKGEPEEAEAAARSHIERAAQATLARLESRQSVA